jgi:hypothetical protein
MVITSVLIASFALAFTVASFWWIQARRGKLRSFPTHTFSGRLSADSAVIRLPVAVFNNGAKPIVVIEFQLRLQADDGREYKMYARTFRNSIMPSSDDIDDFPFPVCIPGRAMDSKFVEFYSGTPPEPLLSGTPVKATLEGLLDGSDRWTELVSFSLHVEIMASTGNYIAYSNHKPTWPAEVVERSSVAFDNLRSIIARARENEALAQPSSE